MATQHLGNGDHSTHLSSIDREDRRRHDSGDILNGVGSASSLTSTSSSGFSANSHAVRHNGKMSTSAFTPLTQPDSSPSKAASPLSIPKSEQVRMGGSPMAFLAADVDRVHSQNATPAPSSPQDRPQIRPPQGEVKGYRAVWDPELDSKLGKEEKRKMKPKIRPFGAEVRLEYSIIC